MLRQAGVLLAAAGLVFLGLQTEGIKTALAVVGRTLMGFLSRAARLLCPLLVSLLLRIADAVAFDHKRMYADAGLRCRRLRYLPGPFLTSPFQCTSTLSTQMLTKRPVF